VELEAPEQGVALYELRCDLLFLIYRSSFLPAYQNEQAVCAKNVLL